MIKWTATKSVLGDWVIVDGNGELVCRELRHLNKDLILSCVNACIPFENPEQDIKRLADTFRLSLERMCESCIIHNPQHAPHEGYEGCKSCREIEIYREALALYREVTH